MELNKTITDKIDALMLLTGKSQEEVMEEALDLYMQTQQKKAMEDELERQRKETTLSYDEFWDGVDL